MNELPEESNHQDNRKSGGVRGGGALEFRNLGIQESCEFLNPLIQDLL
jgi:hypothetical protein